MNQDHILIEYLLSDRYAPEKSDISSGTGPEESLRSDERRQAALEMRRIADEMPGGFFIYRADGIGEIIYANKALFRLFNCETQEEFEEWTGNTFWGMVYPEDRKAVRESIEKQTAANSCDPDYVKYRIMQKGGVIRWIGDYSHFFHSEFAGDVFYVFMDDVIENYGCLQEEREEFLYEKEENEQRLQSRIEAYDKELEALNQEQLRRLELIEGLSIDYESIFYVDFDAEIFQPYRIGPRIRNRFGSGYRVYSFCEFNDFALEYTGQWVYPEDQDVFLSSVEYGYIRKRLSGRNSFPVKYRVMADGNIEYMTLNIVNVGNGESGTQVIIGCRSVDDDIRYEMEQNKILEDALSQAKAANMVKNIFLSNMSHDIRTPMNAIVGFTALAKAHREDAEKLSMYLDRIEAASSQMIQLVDDVLELSRIESDTLHIEETVCDLRDIVRDVKEAVLSQAEAKGLRITAELDAVKHFEVYTDRRYLVQSLLRLADNAVKYTPKGGKIAIIVTEQKASHGFASYKFSVEDTGIGISRDFLENIFEPFERQNNTTMSGVQGTGLGLTIAKNMVEMMGGIIEVSSVLGQGSRFTIVLSLRLYYEHNEFMEASVSQLQERVRRQAPRRILLVEDNEINREIEAELLTDSGFLVDMAFDGSIAVEMVKHSSPGDYCLILMDIQMPVMDGYEAARTIRRLDNPSLANIPIIALSANNFEEDRKMSMSSGMNAHMGKPIHLGQLLKMIEDVIGEGEADS